MSSSCSAKAQNHVSEPDALFFFFCTSHHSLPPSQTHAHSYSGAWLLLFHPEAAHIHRRKRSILPTPSFARAKEAKLGVGKLSEQRRQTSLAELMAMPIFWPDNLRYSRTNYSPKQLPGLPLGERGHKIRIPLLCLLETALRNRELTPGTYYLMTLQ